MPAPPAAPCPAGTGEQQPGTAASPGIGVPVSVWPATPAPGPGTGSRPGGRACHHGVLPAGRAGRHPRRRDRGAPDRSRRSRPPGPRACSPARPPATRPGCAWTGTSARRARPLAQARAGGPALLLEAGCPEAGQAALAITGRGSPGGSVLYAACERVLRPGGVLAVITASTPRPAGLRDDPGEVIAAARAAGLIYAQHIVALHAAITDGQITPGPAGRRPPGRGRRPPGRPRPHPQRPARVHQARRNPR